MSKPAKLRMRQGVSYRNNTENLTEIPCFFDSLRKFSCAASLSILLRDSITGQNDYKKRGNLQQIILEKRGKM